MIGNASTLLASSLLGIKMQDFSNGPGEMRTGRLGVFRVGLLLSGAVEQWWRHGGVGRYRKHTPGDMDMTAPGEIQPSSWTGDSRVLAVGLAPSLVRNVLAETSRGDLPDVPRRFLGSADTESARGIVLRLQALMYEGAGNALEAEELGAALVMWISKMAGDAGPRIYEPADGLSRPAIRRVVDFIDANVGEEIRLQQLSSVAGLSPFHFCRAFRRTTGISPWQYVMRWRVDRVFEAMCAGSRDPLVTLAGRFGFADQSHLNRVCKRVKGCTPGQLLQRLGIQRGRIQPGRAVILRGPA